MTTPRQNVIVDLIKDGNKIATLNTDVNGDVSFEGIPEGTYDIKIYLPIGRYIHTNDGRNEIIDNDSEDNSITNHEINLNSAYALFSGINVSKNSSAQVNALLSPYYGLSFVLTFTPNTGYDLRLESSFPITGNQYVTISHQIFREGTAKSPLFEDTLNFLDTELLSSPASRTVATDLIDADAPQVADYLIVNVLGVSSPTLIINTQTVPFL